MQLQCTTPPEGTAITGFAPSPTLVTSHQRRLFRQLNQQLYLLDIVLKKEKTMDTKITQPPIMYLTIKTKTANPIQYDFDTLLNSGPYNQTYSTTKRTVKTTIPKTTPKHITYCKTLLDQLVNTFPTIHDLTKEAIAKHYTRYNLKKKNGGYRAINAPDEALKTLQRSILQTLQNFGELEHDSAFAYIKKRSIYDAIKKHQNNNSYWFLKIDLKSFFDSCSEKFIYQQLIKIYPYSLLILEKKYDTIIKQIINIACLNGVLPQGNPLAPYFTNLIMIPIDYELDKLTPVYTRYSDDMLFSARTKIDVDKITQAINFVLKDTPLKINKEKTRLGSRNGNNWNLGLMLNKDNNITIGHEKKRIYKATIDQFLRQPETAYTLEQQQKLAGITAYYLHIEPQYFTYIINKYNKKHNKDLLNILHHNTLFNW